jgi:hypothetical protein
MKHHQKIDERSLAFGRAIASQLKEHPEIVSRAQATLDRWMKTCSPRTLPALQQWQAALEGPLEAVIALLTDDDERCAQLRQSNPFAGVLSQEQRKTILRQFQSNDPAAA